MSRFTVTYRIFARSEAEARERALGVALEQTVEVPADVVPEGYIADEIVGRVEEIGVEGEGRYRAAISYSPDSTGTDLPQVLNVLFGNSSIQKGIKVTALDLGQSTCVVTPTPSPTPTTPAPVEIQVLSVSDWHGQLDPIAVSGAGGLIGEE